MEKNKNDILKKGLISPDTDFSSKLMDKINSEETALSNVIAKHGVDSPSPDFTSQLMKQLEGKSPLPVYKPAISASAWIAIAAVSAGIIGLSIFYVGTSSGKSGIELDFNFQNISTGITHFFTDRTSLMYILLGVLLLSLSLILDRRVGEKV